MKKPILLILFLSFFTLTAIAQKQSFKFTTSNDGRKQSEGISIFILGIRTKNKGEITISPPVKKVVNKTDKIKVTDTLETNLIVKGDKYIVECGKQYSVFGRFTKLDVSDNLLNSLDVSALTNLTHLGCRRNNLKELDVSNLSKLTYLDCNFSVISKLALLGCINLKYLDCSNSDLQSLDVSECKKLKTLKLEDNRFSVCALDSLFLTLPRRKSFAKASIYIYHSRLEDFDNDHRLKFRTYIANDNNWRVIHTSPKNDVRMDYKTASDLAKAIRDGTLSYSVVETEIRNSEFSCPEAVGQSFKFKSSGNSFRLSNNTETSGEIRILPPVKNGKRKTDIIEIGNSYRIDVNREYTIASKFSNLDISSNKLTSLSLYGMTSLVSLSCQNNKLSSIDMLGITNLKELYCYNNKFSVCELDKLFLRLPLRLDEDSAKIYFANNNFDNKINNKCRTNYLKDRKWKALNYKNDTLSVEILNSEFTCKGTSSFKFKAGNSDFKLGSKTKKKGGNIAIFPAVRKVLSATNIIKKRTLYEIDPNVEYTVVGNFTKLDVSSNSFYELDVSSNSLYKLDVSSLINLKYLDCSENTIRSLDASSLTKLTHLYCQENFSLKKLNISSCAKLKHLDCSNYELKSLDLSDLKNLKTILCYKNYFTVCALDSIFDALPQRRTRDKAKITLSNNYRYEGCRTYIANDKDWRVMLLRDQPYLFDSYLFGDIRFYLEENNEKNKYDWILRIINRRRYDDYEIKNTKFSCYETSNQYFKFKSSGNSFKLSNNTETSHEISISPQVKIGGKETDNIEIGFSYTINPDTEYTIRSKFSKLDLRFNQITSLTLSAAGSLTSLNCQDNELASLDVLDLKKLVYLTCNNNQLTSLKLRGLINLKEVCCYNNKFSACELDSLFLTLAFREEQDSARIYIANNDLSNGINNKCRTNYLTERKWKAFDFKTDSLSEEIKNTNFACEKPPSFKFVSSVSNFKLGTRTQKKAGNITIFPAVKKEGVKTNLITIGEEYLIDANTEYTLSGVFEKLDISSNKLNSLDVSDLHDLADLYCEKNELANIDLSTLSNLKVLCCSMNQFTGLDISGLSILYRLYCDNNQLTSINLSGSTSLRRLACNNNQLKSLEISDLTNLISLNCANNQISVLNFFTLKDLEYFNCSNNQLTNLDVSSLVSLGKLSCHTNQLSSLEISNLSILYELYCSNNQLTSLDVSSLSNLTKLNCANNQIPELKVSELKFLESFDCSNNQLTSLDFSKCMILNKIYCYNNNFSVCALDSLFETLPKKYLNDKAYIYISYEGVDDGIINRSRTYIAKDKNWKVMNYDDSFISSYSSERSHTEIVNAKFNCSETNQQNFKFVSSGTIFKLSENTKYEGGIIIYPSVEKGNIKTNIIEIDSSYSINSNTEYTLSSRFLKLDVSSNKLTKLNLAATGSLISLNCQNNELTNLDLLSLTNLKELYCYNNNFSACALDTLFLTLPFREEQDTVQIYIANNNLENEINNKCHTDYLIDKKWKALDYVNDTSSIEIKNSEFTCNKASSFKFTSTGSKFMIKKYWLYTYPYLQEKDHTLFSIFPAVIKDGEKTNLIRKMESYVIDVDTEYTVVGNFIEIDRDLDVNCLDISSNNITELDVSDVENLEVLDCSNNQLVSLDVSGLSKLTSLHCSRNNLTSIHFSDLKSLNYLYCSKNQLRNLDLLSLENLKGLDCNDNKLINLEFSNLNKLYWLRCASNQLTSLDASGLKRLEELECQDNQLTRLDFSGLNNLEKIWCSQNNFSICALDSLFLSLPKKRYLDSRWYILYIGDKSNKSEFYDKCRSYIAKNKNWIVASSLIERKIKMKIKYDPVEMENSEFSCEETKEIDVPVKKE